MSKLNHVMIDLETLSRERDAAIVSIGAVKFSLKSPETENFIINISPESCKEYDRHFCSDTIGWWSKQSKEAIDSWRLNSVPMQEGINAFLHFIGVEDDKYTKYWSKGIIFDYPILESSIRVLGKKEPWRYYNVYDLRTAIYLADFDDKNAARVGVGHSALDDCLTQVQNLKLALGCS